METATPDLMIFGSSRASHHYKPEVFEHILKMNCYNAGKDGNQILYHYAVLQSVLKRYKPQIIILDISLRDLVKSDNNYDWLSSLLPYYKNHPEVRPIVDLRSQFEKYKLLSETYPFNSMILSILKGNKHENGINKKEDNGYLPLEKEWKHPLTTDTLVKFDKIDTIKLQYFEKFIESCKKANVNLYISFSPIYIHFNEPPITLKVTQEACLRYNIPFYDFSTDSAFINKPTLFQDRSHLNDKGATVYSEILAGELKKYNPTNNPK